MCVVTILHCTSCKSRQDMPEEGHLVTKDWHTQLLINLDTDTIPFRRCIEAMVHALSISRSDTVEYPRCRNVEVKHLVITKDICFRCSTRRKIQNLVVMRKLYEDQFATWEKDRCRNAEAMKDMRKSISELPRSVSAMRRKINFGAAAEILAASIFPGTSMVESWEHCLGRQIQQRELLKAKEAERLAKLANEEEQKEKRKQARLASVQQCLARINRLRGFPMEEDNIDESSSSPGQLPLELRSAITAQMAESEAGSLFDEMVASQAPESMPGPTPSQNDPALPETPSSAVATRVGSSLPSSSRFMVRCHATGPTIAVKAHLSGKESSVGAATHSVINSSSVQGSFTMRAEAPEFASLRGFPGISGTGPLRAEAHEFKPLRHVPPTEPRMMRAPTSPRAMREGSLRQASTQPRQKYFSNRGYPTIRGWRD